MSIITHLGKHPITRYSCLIFSMLCLFGTNAHARCQGLEECRQHAENGNADAQYSLALEYKLSEQYEQAFKWLNKASRNGNLTATAELGYYYQLANSAKDGEIYEWYSRAQELSQEQALSWFLKGVKHDKEKNEPEYMRKAAEGPVQEINGFDELVFGMSVKEALKASPESNLNKKCPYRNTNICIMRPVQVMSEKGKLAAQFDNESKKLKQIVLSFDYMHKNKEECRPAASRLVTAAIDKYGSPTLHQGVKFEWHSPFGGNLSISYLCISEKDGGIVTISYKQTSAL